MIDRQKVKALVDQWLADKDYFFVDLTIDENNRIVVEIDHKDGVWIEDCCDSSRFIESGLDREVEDFELEVGSAGIGQPFKVVEQYVCNVGREVEVMTLEGKKLVGVLDAADADGFTLKYVEKQRIEGKKRPVAVDVERRFGYPDAKWVKVVIKF